MTYTSKIINDYNAVFQHVEKLQTTYKGYGIYFDWDVVISEEGYKVIATAKELETI